MRQIVVLSVFLIATSTLASDIRDLLNGETGKKTATFSYGQPLNFLVVGGPRDGFVTLRAFRGTKDEVVARAKAWAPNCANLQHFVFGGWWTSRRRISFADRFKDWSVPEGSADGKWVFVFDVQPASTRVNQAGFLGLQDLQIDQAMIDDYFSTAIDITVLNTRPTRRVSSSQPFNNTPQVSVQILPGGDTTTHGTNTISAPVMKPLECTNKPRVLPETTLITVAPSRNATDRQLAKKGSPASITAETRP